MKVVERAVKPVRILGVVDVSEFFCRARCGNSLRSFVLRADSIFVLLLERLRGVRIDRQMRDER